MMPMPDIFAVYKPKDPTSYEVVREIRKITGARQDEAYRDS